MIRSNPRSLSLATAFVAVLASPAVAQQTVSPELVRADTIMMHSPWLSALRRLAATGNSERLANGAREMLEDLNALSFKSPECCDLSKNYFLVTFVSYDPSGTPSLVAVLVHRPMPESSALPGLHGNKPPPAGVAPVNQLYEIFLTEPSGLAKLTDVYSVAREENPADKQLSDFISTVVGKVAFPTATRPQGGKFAAPPPPPPAQYSVAVQMGHVILPVPGKITVRSIVTYTNINAHTSGLSETINGQQKDELRLKYGGNEPQPSCSNFSDLLARTIKGTLGSSQCGAWISDAAVCGKKVNDDLANAAKTYLAMPPSPACPIDLSAQLLQGYAGVAQDMKPLTATTTIANSALVRYGYGLAFGYIAHIGIDSDHPRTQIQSGKIAADPFGRQLTMGVVNLTPWGFDGQLQSPSRRERARLFIGPLFTPYYGVAGGFAFGVNRYVALNVGYARLWYDTPKPGEMLDQAPTAANKGAPFELRSTGAIFFGVGYNLK